MCLGDGNSSPLIESIIESRVQVCSVPYYILFYVSNQFPSEALLLPGDPGQCLKEVLKRWLRKNYDHHKYGHPSWRFLVRAVGDPNGGNDCALAETIGKNHAGKLKCCF